MSLNTYICITPFDSSIYIYTDFLLNSSWFVDFLLDSLSFLLISFQKYSFWFLYNWFYFLVSFDSCWFHFHLLCAYGYSLHIECLPKTCSCVQENWQNVDITRFLSNATLESPFRDILHCDQTPAEPGSPNQAPIPVSGSFPFITLSTDRMTSKTKKCQNKNGEKTTNAYWGFMSNTRISNRLRASKE